MWLVPERKALYIGIPLRAEHHNECIERPSAWMAVLGIIFASLVGDRAHAGLDGNDVPGVAFFGFEFLNTSLEPTTQTEVKRINLLDEALRQKLATSGRFEIVYIPPDITNEI